MNASQRTFLACVGTRPEIIKMAMLHRELQKRGHRVVVLHTGQHEEVAQALYRFFSMPPDIEIDLKRKSGGLSHLTMALMDGIEDAMQQVRPDIVMVQGDTTTALAGALVGSYHRLPVAHVEAGLRTYEREPFPEEMNRALIGRLARWHFAPTAQSRRNLLGEGIDEDCIHQVGNPVIDATLWTREVISRPGFELAEFAPAGLCRFLTQHKGRPAILVTAHRRENWGQPIANIATAIARILATHEDVVAVWPVHPNPAVMDDIGRGLAGLEPAIRARIELTGPLEYPAMITLLTRCVFTVTDSGGIQEEASALRVPVLIVRDSTERQELVDAGGAVIVGTSVKSLMARACALLDDPAARRGMELDQSPFGDGRSAQRIAGILSAQPMRRSAA